MSKKVLQKLTAITTAAVLAASIAPLSASAAWDQDANSNWSWTENGQKATGWRWIHGNWYYFDGSGIMQTGWKYINSQWYYMDSSGAMKTGWQFINGEWYHLGTDGAMTKGWYKEGSSWYHLNENGVMARHWRKISNVWYRFNPSGQMQTGWITYHDDTYFGNIDGAIQTGLVQIDNKVYYFREEADSRQGAMETGRIQIGDRTYTFGEDGAATGILLPEAEIAYDSNGNEKTPGGVVSGGGSSSSGGGGGGSWSGGGSGGGSSYVDAQRIALNETSLDMNVGESFLLTATVYPTNATNKVVSWTSSNTSVATVDDDGRVRALQEGTATITAIVDEVKATCTVRVAATSGEDVKVTGITVTSTSGSDEVHVGEDLQLQAAVTPDNATNKAVEWSSSDTEIATVDANGLVTGVAEGTATITATAADGSGVTGTFDVTVTEKPETESATPTFTTNLESSMDVTVGDEVTLSVVATSSDGGTLTYQWYKDDEAISDATSASYTFTADAAGSASYKVVVTNTKDDLTPASATSTTCVVTVENGEEPPVESDNLLYGIAPTTDINTYYFAYWHHEEENPELPLLDGALGMLTDGLKPAVDVAYEEKLPDVLYFNDKAPDGAPDFTFDLDEPITFEQINLAFRLGGPWGATDGLADHVTIAAEIDGEWQTIYDGEGLRGDNTVGKDLVFKTADGTSITATGLRFWFHAWTGDVKGISIAEIEALAEATDATADGELTGGSVTPPVSSTIDYTATGTPEVKFVNGLNDEESLAKVSYADGKFTVAGDVTSFSFVDGGVAKQFTNTDGVWSDAVEISKSLIFGESFTTDINRDNFGYFSSTYDNPMFFTSLTDGVVPPTADCNQFGYVNMATTRPEGINKDICFNLDHEITFKQINIDFLKQYIWNAADGYPEHVTIEANFDGVWAEIADVTGLDTTGTDGTPKTLVFTSEEPITTSGLRFTFYSRQGNAQAVILTGIDVLAEADGSPADGALEVPSEVAETPVITTDLEASKTVEVGETVELAVEASVSDGGTLTYQWYKNDEPITGATSSTYSFQAFTAETATYKVEVTNTKEGMLPSKVTSTACVVSAVTDLVNIAKGASYTFTSTEGKELNFSGSAIDDGVKLTDDITPNTTTYGDPGFVTFHVKEGSDASTLDIVIDLGAAKSFKRVTIDTLKSTDGVNPIETGMVSYSMDDSDWTEFGAINHTHGDVGIETIMVNSEEPVTAQYVKVTLNGVSGWRSLAEIRVWGEAVFEAVTDITGVPTEATAGTDLELTGTVAPATATNQTIVWSVKDAGETGATIEGNVLKTTAAGTVTVTATITNGAAEDADFTKDFTITVKEAPVVTSDNLLAGKTWTSTTVTTQSLFDKPLSENASQWLTDGEKPVVDDYTEEFHANGGVVLFYHSTDKPLQSFVYDLEDGKNTFKQIQISTLYAAAGDTIVGSTPKTIKIEAEVNGEWVTLFENAEPYANANESKNFVFSSDTPITATQLRFSFAGQGREGAGIGWPGVALNEIEVLADAATGAIDGTLEAPEVPVESGNLLAGKTWTSTTVEKESYGEAAFVEDANKWLTDGEKPTPNTISGSSDNESEHPDKCGVVLFYNNEDHPVQSFVYDLDPGQDTFRQITISTLYQQKVASPENQILGTTPKKIKIEAYIDDQWVVLFENKEDNQDLKQNKVFVFSSDTAITASQLRFSFVAQGTGWPGIALNEIEVLADAATGAIDGTLEAPEAPAYVAVTDITGVPAEATAGTDLELTGTVTPDNATNKTIVWSVKDAGETGATIEGSTLKTTAAGTVTVTATITNGAAEDTDYTKDFTITVNEASAVEFTNIALDKSYTITSQHADWDADHPTTGTEYTDGVYGNGDYSDLSYAHMRVDNPDLDTIIEFDLGAEYDINGIQLSGYYMTDYYIYAPKNFRLEYFDGSEWKQLVASPDSITYPTGEGTFGGDTYKAVLPDNGTVKAQQVRVVVRPWSNGLYFDEIEILGIDNGEEPPVSSEIAYTATGTPEVKFVNGYNDSENIAKVSYADSKFTVASDVTSFSFVDGGVAKQFTNTDGVWSEAVTISNSLIFGESFTTDINRDNFGYFSSTYDHPMFSTSLTDGVVPPTADCNQFGYVTLATTRPEGLNKDICFNLDDEITFSQINIDLLKQTVWNAADGYPEHVTIEANLGGVWAEIADVTGLDTTGTDGTAKTLVFTSEEPITASGLRFTFYARQGNALAVILTGIDVLAEADGSPADGTLEAPTESAETPTITTDLEASKTVDVGETVELSVGATVSAGTLSYQWYKDDVAIQGATSSTYSFTAYTTETATYKVEITNTQAGMLPSKVTSTACVVEATTDLTNIAKGASYTFTSTEGLELNFSGSARDDGVKLTDDITPNSTSYGDAGFVTFHVLGGTDASTLDVVIDLGEEKSFERVTIDTLKGTDGVSPVETGMISYSSTGADDWKEFGAINHTHGDVGVETIMVNSDEPVTAQYVKVTIDKVNGWRNLAEIRVWSRRRGT